MQQKPRMPSMRLPALVCLVGAIGFLLYCRCGGEVQVEQLLDAVARNPQFVQQALAVETGMQPQPVSQVEQAPAVTAPAVTASPTPWIPLAAENAFSIPATTTAPVEFALHTLALSNETDYTVDTAQALTQPRPFSTGEAGVQVVIYHTHATEAYTPDGADDYNPLSQERTLDNTQNVVRVGEELTEVLERHGITVLHLTDTFDYPSYEGSYAASQRAIEQVVADNPSVVCTIDLHRDAVYNDDGTPIARTATVAGAEISPMMLVVGTDASGLTHDHWRDNFTFACQLQNQIMTLAPDLMRPINLRRQRFNQHVTTGSLILECGWSGNTLQQALASVRIFGEGLATLLAPTTP